MILGLIKLNKLLFKFDWNQWEKCKMILLDKTFGLTVETLLELSYTKTFFKDFIYLLLERGEERKRTPNGGEKH